MPMTTVYRFELTRRSAAMRDAHDVRKMAEERPEEAERFEHLANVLEALSLSMPEPNDRGYEPDGRYVRADFWFGKDGKCSGLLVGSSLNSSDMDTVVGEGLAETALKVGMACAKADGR